MQLENYLVTYRHSKCYTVQEITIATTLIYVRTSIEIQTNFFLKELVILNHKLQTFKNIKKFKSIFFCFHLVF